MNDDEIITHEDCIKEDKRLRGVIEKEFGIPFEQMSCPSGALSMTKE